MKTDCQNCGDRLQANITRKMESGDQVEYCDSCGAEVGRIEDIESKRSNALGGRL